MNPKVAIIGAGPAGMCAAAAAAQNGWTADLYDHNEKTGKKLFITGKGRCNLTNDRPIEDFFDQVVTNGKFLYSSLYTFTNDQLEDMIEAAGCRLKTERGGRVFPVSDKSSDILKAFNRLLVQNHVHVMLGTHISALVLTDDHTRVCGIRLKNGEVRDYDAVILATGGVSYRSTGSDGSGFRIAEKAGHSVTELRPSLVGLDTREDWPGTLAGLTLKNVKLTLYRHQKGKKVRLYDELGEMLFTHTGISGPLVLSASARVKGNPSQYSVDIDLKPGLTDQKLDARILRDFEEGQNKNLDNVMAGLLPRRMIPVIIDQAGLIPDQKAGSVTREQRHALVQTLKALPLRISGLGDINGAIITSGGIPVKEVDPGTMHSKLVQGLSFAGEMLDVDAVTGGYNIQIACSTGWLAGSSLEIPEKQQS
ncbi:MAG: NAD(P)/FAD-dependent oxidoreductase [Eubacteriaceae bacterium]|jgi:predicted Rossmann fold flavoprotein